MKTPGNLKHQLLFLSLLFLCFSVYGQDTELFKKIKQIKNITKTQILPTHHFEEKYVTYFTQPLDHKHPEKGSFQQRVIVSHTSFDRPTVLVTEGYGGNYALHPNYREELSKLLDANLIFVEYRYFLESTPQPKDWQYLTAESSADDLHAVATAFKTIYKGKWIATGISKGGQTTLLYRTFYPNDVDISVPYVAPLCFKAEDGRHEPFLKHVGSDKERKRIEDFQLEIFKRKASLLPAFKEYCKKQRYTFRIPLEEIFDFTVLEYSFALWQWGTPVHSIPATHASNQELLNHLLEISEPGYFSKETKQASFFVQAARELGYYGYDIRPFKPYLSIKSAKGYLNHIMLPDELRDMKFDKTLSRKIKKFLQKNDPKMMFIYGENDPWTAAGVTWLKNKQNIHIFIEPGGSHKARINTLPQEKQKEAIQLLHQWLKQ